MEYLQRVERNGIFIIIQGGSEEELLDLRVHAYIYTCSNGIHLSTNCEKNVWKMFRLRWVQTYGYLSFHGVVRERQISIQRIFSIV